MTARIKTLLAAASISSALASPALAAGNACEAEILRAAERYGVYLGIEPHQSISKTTTGLLRIATLVESPFLGVNYDTGNAYLGGEDPYEGLAAVAGRVVHVHEVAGLLAVAEDRARLPRLEAAGEDGDDAGLPVGVLAGAVDVGQGQRRELDVVQVPVGGQVVAGRLLGRDLTGLHAVLLARADAPADAVLRQHDCVRLHPPAHAPRELGVRTVLAP